MKKIIKMKSIIIVLSVLLCLSLTNGETRTKYSEAQYSSGDRFEGTGLFFFLGISKEKKRR